MEINGEGYANTYETSPPKPAKAVEESLIEQED
jgi:hypothetical protein